MVSVPARAARDRPHGDAAALLLATASAARRVDDRGGRTGRDPAALDRHVADRISAPPPLLGYQWQLAAIAGWTSAHWLHRLPQPTLVLAGDDDPSFRWPTPAFWRAGFPVARLHVVPGGGHLFLLDQPGDVVDVVADFLADPSKEQE